jgi:hypothetical protein
LVLPKVKIYPVQKVFQYAVRAFAYIAERRRIDIVAMDIFAKPFVFRIITFSTESVNVDNQRYPSFIISNPSSTAEHMPLKKQMKFVAAEEILT